MGTLNLQGTHLQLRRHKMLINVMTAYIKNA